MPRRLAPRRRTRPHPADRRTRRRNSGSPPAPTAQVRRDKAAANGEDTAELDQLIADLDDELAAAGIRGNLATRTNDRQPTGERQAPRPGPPAAARTPPNCPAAPDDRPDDRPGLHDTGRQDLPAVDVPHPHLRQLRQSPRRRHPGRPGPLRLPASRPGRDPLPGAVRPAHPEPAPLPRLRRPVLRRHRTSETAGPARAHRVPRRHLPRRSARRSSPRPTTRSGGPPPTPCGTTRTDLPVWHEASGSYVDPAPGELLPTWDQALDAIGPARSSPGTSPGSGPSSTPRACSPDPKTPAAASATSPST